MQIAWGEDRLHEGENPENLAKLRKLWQPHNSLWTLRVRRFGEVQTESFYLVSWDDHFQRSKRLLDSVNFQQNSFQNVG